MSRQPIQKRREPAFIEPMQCKPVTALPAGENWTFEIKFDGYRCIGVKRRVRSGRSEALLDQAVDRVLVDDHDLLDLDLLVVDVDHRLAEAGDLDAVDDRRAAEHQLGDRHHGVAGVRRGSTDSLRGWCHPMISGLACEGQHRADHGDFLAKAFFAHRIARADRAV